MNQHSSAARAAGDGEVPASVRKVAVIGVGSMGQPMAKRLHEAGFELTVCDKNEASLKEFAALGVRTTSLPSDCADCDAVIVLVATPGQVRTVTVGESGVQGGGGTGGPRSKPRYLVVMSTVAPKDMLELASALGQTSMRLMDAPVSGGVVGARQGTLTVLAGGAAADIAALDPVFRAIGKNIFHCGPVATGQTTKVVNNLIAISNLMISAEAYRIADSNGLKLDQIMPALDAGSARNFLSRDAGYARDTYAAWSGSADEYRAVQSINRKDFDLALSICPTGVSFPTIAALRQLLDKVGDETLDHWRAVAGQRQA